LRGIFIPSLSLALLEGGLFYDSQSYKATIQLLLKHGADPHEQYGNITPIAHFFEFVYHSIGVDRDIIQHLSDTTLMAVECMLQCNVDFKGALDITGLIVESHRANYGTPTGRKGLKFVFTSKIMLNQRGSIEAPVIVKKDFAVPLVAIVHFVSQGKQFKEELSRGEFEPLEAINKRVMDELMDQVEAKGLLEKYKPEIWRQYIQRALGSYI